MTDWVKKRLGDISESCLGKMLDKEKNKGSYQPYLANLNVQWGEFKLESLQKMRFEEREQERYGLENGDLIICEGGEPGRCAIWRGEVANMKIQKALHRLRVRPGYCGDFLYYRMRLAGKNRELDRHFIGSTIKHLTGIGLKDVEFEFPKLDEQKKRSKILRSLDSKIELNNKINAELEAMSKLIYDYWFVQFDFPDANGNPYKSSGGKMVYNEALKREIPDGWNAGRCSDLFELNPTLSIKKGEISSHIDMNALPTSGFMTKQVKRKQFSGGMKFQNGDVVIARITPCLENGKTGLISLLNENEIGFGSTEFIILRGQRFDLRCFGACLARSEKFRKYAISKMTGTSGRKRVNYTAIESYEMPIPDETLLKKFERKITPFFEKMTANTKENQELTKLRDWLLPMLMNGQVTVKNSKKKINQK